MSASVARIRNKPTTIVILSGSRQRYSGSATFGSLLLQGIVSVYGLITWRYTSMNCAQASAGITTWAFLVCMRDILESVPVSQFATTYLSHFWSDLHMAYIIIFHKQILEKCSMIDLTFSAVGCISCIVMFFGVSGQQKARYSARQKSQTGMLQWCHHYTAVKERKRDKNTSPVSWVSASPTQTSSHLFSTRTVFTCKVFYLKLFL